MFTRVNKYNLKLLYFADSYGSFNQRKLLERLERAIDKNEEVHLHDKCSLGLHLHNNM